MLKICSVLPDIHSMKAVMRSCLPGARAVFMAEAWTRSAVFWSVAVDGVGCVS